VIVRMLALCFVFMFVSHYLIPIFYFCLFTFYFF